MESVEKENSEKENIKEENIEMVNLLLLIDDIICFIEFPWKRLEKIGKVIS